MRDLVQKSLLDVWTWEKACHEKATLFGACPAIHESPIFPVNVLGGSRNKEFVTTSFLFLGKEIFFFLKTQGKDLFFNLIAKTSNLIETRNY